MAPRPSFFAGLTPEQVQALVVHARQGRPRRRLSPIQEERRRILAENAGAVACRVSPQTGRLVTVYDGEAAGMDTTAGRWQTVCEAHGHIISHTTRQLAFWHLADPQGWCEECR